MLGSYIQRACVVLIFSIGSVSIAESPQDVVKIEEYWELSIKDPDASYAAPQITNAFAPVKQGEVLYATFNLNHRLGNDVFEAGGLELELWHGDLLLGRKSSDKQGLLATPGEVVKWRQVIDISDNGVIRFSIKDGTSTTWGTFGSSLSLAIATTLQSLNDYHPNDSINHSGTVFAANRVNYRKLAKVIATLRSGQTVTLYTVPTEDN